MLRLSAGLLSNLSLRSQSKSHLELGAWLGKFQRRRLQ